LNRSNFLFILLLVCVSSTQIDSLLDTETDLENIPEFVELSGHPISQAFFSAAALRMKEEKGRGGFSKIISLIEDLIRDNRKQIHKIDNMAAKVLAQCLVTTHKFKDRSIFFSGQTMYFKTRGAVAVEEKSESFNILNSRNAQAGADHILQVAATQRHTRQQAKWGGRVNRGMDAIKLVNAALTAVNNWSPSTKPAFIQESIKNSLDAFMKVKNVPISVPNELIQLAANDVQVRKRLFQWLNLLKSSVQDAVVFAKDALNAINMGFKNYDTTLTALQVALKADAQKLGFAIQSLTTLIKVYEENEKIYTNLASQNALLIEANSKWCQQEKNNFMQGRKAMTEQLRVFGDLRGWLRKHYSQVKGWLRKKYNH